MAKSIPFAFIRSVDFMEKALGALEKLSLKVVTQVQPFSIKVNFLRPVIDVKQATINNPRMIRYIFVILKILSL